MAFTVKLKHIALLIAVLLCSYALTACGGDDEPGRNSNSLVGIWSCSSRFYLGTDYYTFRKNGTYSWRYVGDWTFNDIEGNYTYNNGLLVLVGNNGYSYVLLAQFSNSNTLIITDEDGDSYTYRRE